MLLSGLYAAASSWIIGFASQTSLTMTNLVCGIAIAVLALAYGSAYGRTHGIACGNLGSSEGPGSRTLDVLKDIEFRKIGALAQTTAGWAGPAKDHNEPLGAMRHD